MDNLAGMYMQQAGNGSAFGNAGYEGIPQVGYAAPESTLPEGFFMLEHSPFDEEVQTYGYQADGYQMGNPADAGSAAVGMGGSLPVAPAKTMWQTQGQPVEGTEAIWGVEAVQPAAQETGFAHSGMVEQGNLETADSEETWLQQGGSQEGCEPEEYGCGADEAEEPEAEEPGTEDGDTDIPEQENPGSIDNGEEDRKRAEHEASEANRRAEWEARQKAKKDAEAAQLARLSSLGDDEVAAEAMKRVGADTEKLTRRNMKDCVTEYIQTLCLEDPEFARLAMHPRKTMIHCFKYINRKAREFVEQEMKDNDVKPENGIYGSDVPDGLCYQWAEDYFRDPDAEEDRAEEEKFVPKPYTGKTAAKPKGKKSAPKKPTGKGKEEKKAAKGMEKAAGQETQEKKGDDGQISFMGQMSFADYAFQEEKAG